MQKTCSFLRLFSCKIKHKSDKLQQNPQKILKSLISQVFFGKIGIGWGYRMEKMASTDDDRAHG